MGDSERREGDGDGETVSERRVLDVQGIRIEHAAARGCVDELQRRLDKMTLHSMPQEVTAGDMFRRQLEQIKETIRMHQWSELHRAD